MQKTEHLPEQFVGRAEVKGFNFKLAQRTNEHLIYEVTQESGIKHYELFEIKCYDKQYDFKTKEQTLLDVPIERYPKAGDFGKWAWTHPSLETAKQKIETLKTKNQC